MTTLDAGRASRRRGTARGWSPCRAACPPTEATNPALRTSPGLIGNSPPARRPEVGKIAQRLVVVVADPAGGDLVGGDVVAQGAAARRQILAGELPADETCIVDQQQHAPLDAQPVGTLRDIARQQRSDHGAAAIMVLPSVTQSIRLDEARAGAEGMWRGRASWHLRGRDLARHRGARPCREVSSRKLAHLQYTSATTFVPGNFHQPSYSECYHDVSRMPPASSSPPGENDRYFQRGFGLRSAISGTLHKDYHSALVDSVRDGGNRIARGDLTFRLAQEFGFCYGVERAVDYAYETARALPRPARSSSPARSSTTPDVNQRLRADGHPLPARTDPRRPTSDLAAGRRRPAAGVRRDRADVRRAARDAAASSWTRPAARCSTSGRTSSGTRATGSPRSSTASTPTRRRAPPSAASALIPGGHVPRRPRHGGGARSCATTSASRRGPRPRFLATLRRGASSPGFDPDRAPRAHRRREPDDDALQRVARDRAAGARGHGAALRGAPRGPRASARSTRSAPPRRTARTPC